MAETFLFPLAQALIEKIASTSFREIGRIWGMESDLKRLEATLTSINAVLEDAAEKQINNKHVRDWVEKLQDVVYDIDDLFDDFTTEELRRKLEIGDSKRKEVSNFFSGSNKTLFRIKMSKKIKKLRDRLDEVNEDRRNYQFIERVFTDRGVHRPREETHGFVHVLDVFGRDREKEEVLQLLLDSKSHDSNLSVLPIVGLGGLGKTTLTKLVYNDPQIEQNFDKKIWVCVSDDFDIRKIVKKILEADTGEKFLELDLDPLRTSLQNRLKLQKFMLVLDDVWNEDPMKWTNLKELLSCGAPGSAIVLTTRTRKIAEMVGTFSPYSLSGLRSDDCMSIFLKYAFKDGHGKAYPRLVAIGKEIVAKCGGLPLAVRTLASLLCTTTDEREWNFIKDNDIWKIPQEEHGVLSILRLSYERMSIHLKQCFAYCSVYPKDTEMDSKMLIYNWISHGLIQPSDANRSLEEIGEQYINELVSRSFFGDVKYLISEEVMCFKMHDLVHDLALLVAGKEVVHCDSAKILRGNVRHLSFKEGYGSVDGKDFPESLLKLEKVRSFRFQFVVGPVTESWLDTLVKSFRCLRSLDLGGAEFETLPNSIGTLQHLRILGLCKNHKITALPNSLCKLLNLVALDLGSCYNLQNLPTNFDKLRRLRCLLLTTKMAHLSENVLRGFSSLRSFAIMSCQCLESLSNEGLQQLTALHELYITDCPRLTSIPQSTDFLTSLKILQIYRCEQLNLLEGQGFQGLRSLEYLVLVGLPILIELPLGIAKFARTLKNLWIQDCPNLESMAELQNCTSLLMLGIINCGSLSSLSSYLHQLHGVRYLKIEGCPLLTTKCKRETGEYWPWISSIPVTYIPENEEAECSASGGKESP